MCRLDVAEQCLSSIWSVASEGGPELKGGVSRSKADYEEAVKVKGPTEPTRPVTADQNSGASNHRAYLYFSVAV